MIKINLGVITNPDTMVKKDIVVRAVRANNLKEMLIGGSLIFLGISYLTVAAVKKDIVVRAVRANNLKEMSIGWSLTFLGISYLTVAAVKNGVRAYEDAEMKTLSDLGLLGDSYSQ